MITIQLQTLEIGDDGRSLNWVPVAEMTAAGERLEMSGRVELFDRSLATPNPRTGEWVRFEEDPEEWARNLHLLYRSPDLAVAVIEDSNPAEQRLDGDEVRRHEVLLSRGALQEA